MYISADSEFHATTLFPCHNKKSPYSTKKLRKNTFLDKIMFFISFALKNLKKFLKIIKCKSAHGDSSHSLLPYHSIALPTQIPLMFFVLQIAIHKRVKVDFLLISVTNTGGSTICR